MAGKNGYLKVSITQKSKRFTRFPSYAITELMTVDMVIQRQTKKIFSEMITDQPYWQTKTLQEMAPEEWEALCDGCAKCCLHKIEDEDTGQVYFTYVACRLLDNTTCRCDDYEHRSEQVKDCVPLSVEMVDTIQWLPRSCAYRRLAEGRGLAWWHPLVSGDPMTVRDAGESVCGKVIPEGQVNLAKLEKMVVDWFD